MIAGFLPCDREKHSQNEFSRTKWKTFRSLNTKRRSPLISDCSVTGPSTAVFCGQISAQVTGNYLVYADCLPEGKWIQPHKMPIWRDNLDILIKQLVRQYSVLYGLTWAGHNTYLYISRGPHYHLQRRNHLPARSLRRLKALKEQTGRIISLPGVNFFFHFLFSQEIKLVSPVQLTSSTKILVSASTPLCGRTMDPSQCVLTDVQLLEARVRGLWFGQAAHANLSDQRNPFCSRQFLEIAGCNICTWTRQQDLNSAWKLLVFWQRTWAILKTFCLDVHKPNSKGSSTVFCSEAKSARRWNLPQRAVVVTAGRGGNGAGRASAVTPQRGGGGPRDRAEGGLARDNAVIAFVMDHAHLGRHAAGKTSAFTCHESQRQYAACNHKINCGFQASVTLPNGRGEAAGALHTKRTSRKRSRQNSSFNSSNCVIKISHPISALPLISSWDYNDTDNSNLSTAFSFVGINSFPANDKSRWGGCKIEQDNPAQRQRLSPANNTAVSPAEKWIYSQYPYPEETCKLLVICSPEADHFSVRDCQLSAQNSTRLHADLCSSVAPAFFFREAFHLDGARTADGFINLQY